MRLRERIGQAATLTGEDRPWRVDRLAALERDWAALAAPCPRASCMATPGPERRRDPRRPRHLARPRTLLPGPPEWDLVSTAVKYVTFGQVTQADYQQFCDAYGQDVINWAGFRVLRDIRELRVTCYAAQQAAEQPNSPRQACAWRASRPTWSPAMAVDPRFRLDHG